MKASLLQVVGLVAFPVGMFGQFGPWALLAALGIDAVYVGLALED